MPRRQHLRRANSAADDNIILNLWLQLLRYTRLEAANTRSKANSLSHDVVLFYSRLLQLSSNAARSNILHINPSRSSTQTIWLFHAYQRSSFTTASTRAAAAECCVRARRQPKPISPTASAASTFNTANRAQLAPRDAEREEHI